MNLLETDTFFNGRVQVKQNQSGYRFSIDAVLLAYHAKPQSGDKVLDLGTGCGIIPLILAYRKPEIKIFGIEIQKELAEIAAINVADNRMKNRINIICRDMKCLDQAMVSGPVDLIVSNPPYRKLNSGRINPNRQRAIARHEIKITLDDVVKTAGRLLRTMGRFVMIYPAERMTDILTRMNKARIEPKFIRMIHSGIDTQAKLILVEGVKGGRPGIKIAPPLIIYRDNNSYTDEVEKMFLP